jgi:hypothetical protein
MTEIEKSNKMIAEFMNVTSVTPENADGTLGRTMYSPYKIWYSVEELRYHITWDWLMPVIEKISIWKFEDGDYCFPRTFGMQSEEGLFMFRFNRHSIFQSETLIEAAYKAVVDFIEFYNKNK